MAVEQPTRKDIEAALRAAGLSHRQARKMLALSWPAVVGEAQAEADELRDRLEALSASLSLSNTAKY